MNEVLFDKILLRCFSSAKSISSHFLLLYHQGPVYQQTHTQTHTHNTFAVIKSLRKFQNKLISIFLLVMDKKDCSTLTHILSNIFARRPISALDRHFTHKCFEKTERIAKKYKKINEYKTSKFSMELDIIQTLHIIFFQNYNVQNFCVGIQP